MREIWGNIERREEEASAQKMTSTSDASQAGKTEESGAERTAAMPNIPVDIPLERARKEGKNMSEKKVPKRAEMKDEVEVEEVERKMSGLNIDE